MPDQPFNNHSSWSDYHIPRQGNPGKHSLFSLFSVDDVCIFLLDVNLTVVGFF